LSQEGGGKEKERKDAFQFFGRGGRGGTPKGEEREKTQSPLLRRGEGGKKGGPGFLLNARPAKPGKKRENRFGGKITTGEKGEGEENISLLL